MGKASTFFRHNWKMLVNIVTLVALVLLVYLIRHQIVDTFHNFGRINIWVVALMIPLQVLGYHAQTRIYQDLFALVGNRLRYWFVYRTTLELNFVNHVFPSGGVSGISYFSVRMRGNDLTASKATLMHVVKLLLQFVSFELLLIMGLFFMALGGRANELVILVASSISTLLVVGTVAFVYIIGSERRIHATFNALAALANRVIHVFRPHYPQTISIERIERIVQDLHSNYKIIEDNYRQLRWPFLWALVLNLTEIFTAYVVYMAFGEFVNFGAVILAYAVANFAGLVSVLPGGVGIYEALMTGVLAAAGIPAALSLPVTVMYRVLNTLIQIPPGYYFYHRNLAARQAVEQMQHEQ